jgi:UDPglucose--hexose-1-phosphate uridylyltransferase
MIRRENKKAEKTAVGRHRMVGEMRQDLVTGKWVVVATERSQKPSDFTTGQKRPQRMAKYKEKCPFCQLDKYPQKPDIVRLPDDPEEWEVHIFGNKYPAFNPCDEFRSWQQGPYRAIESVGYHEILATRWHDEADAYLTQRQMALQIEALELRYRQLREKPSVSYIQIIKNSGEGAGASLEHPHNQIFTVPVIPSDVHDILMGAEKYRQQHNENVFQTIIDWEKREGVRLIDENDDFILFCPYASRVAYEMWIVPKKHDPYFENMTPKQRDNLAELLRGALARLYVGLNDPPYNYYILSAPCDDTGFVSDRKIYKNFRWHIQILPRLSKWGGFEMGTGLEITTVLPEEAAAYLRGQNIDQLLV